MKVTLVKQKYKFGCSVACAAMVLQKTYEEVEKEFSTNLNIEGVDEDFIFKYIADKGYSIIQKDILYYNKLEFGREELLNPFAEVHMLKVQLKADSTIYHWVVVDKNGKIFCPIGKTDEEIKTCYQFMKVIGIYKDK